MKTIELFKQEPEVLDFYQKKFRYIHVDEYQDTNHAQYMLCRYAGGRLTATSASSATATSRSIAGAERIFRNILNFEKDYPEAKTILLEQNYRSTGQYPECGE